MCFAAINTCPGYRLDVEPKLKVNVRGVLQEASAFTIVSLCGTTTVSGAYSLSVQVSQIEIR